MEEVSLFRHIEERSFQWEFMNTETGQWRDLGRVGWRRTVDEDQVSWAQDRETGGRQTGSVS